GGRSNGAASCSPGSTRASCGASTSTTAATSTLRRSRRDALRLRFASQQERDVPVRIKLHDHARHLIDHPDVVLRIDAQLLRFLERIGILADFADIFPGLIELEEPGAAMSERARRTQRNGRMPGSRVNEDVAFRVGRDARG